MYFQMEQHDSNGDETHNEEENADVDVDVADKTDDAKLRR
jgi:hypothetical protein